MRLIRSRFVCGCIAVAVLAPSAYAQTGGSSSTRPLSSAVVASWSSRWGKTGTAELLVLWRGTPGWFANGEGSGSGTSSGSGSSLGHGWAYDYVTEGGKTFVLSFDLDRSIVKILDEEISLARTNLVLVDFVDGPDGPRIVDRRWIDTTPPPESRDPLPAIIRRTPGLFEYLRCDVQLPDQLQNKMAQMLCAGVRP